MRAGLLRDTCEIYTLYDQGDASHGVTVNITASMQKEIKRIEKAFWSVQTTLEKLYERAKKQS